MHYRMLYTGFTSFRVSPERLYADLCMIETDVTKLEKLANITGLDVRHLCMVMAEHHITAGGLSYARDLMALARVLDSNVISSIMLIYI